ncbi:MAG TPA: Fic family protein [Candidatus Diapherotrites archaeon]|uniref:Fic family protein n=1 Tax=Candidatus Iainarchaeum sp. TaxID=3101447 RepID=A0A7J4IXA7_9ARCH|nr:Fic family protein [Candidatus Diapherotrites archaeon]
MAYLSKQKIGKGTYYYLVENIPVGKGKRKQIREYIGNEKPSESKLQILISEFEKKTEKEIIKLHGHHYLTNEEIKEIDQINSQFWRRYKNENSTVQEQFDENFVMAFVYNTNSIEGSTLSPKEVELLLSENIAPNKPLEDVLEAKAAQKTLKFAKEYNGEFTQEFIQQIHEMYFKDTKPRIAGKYKTHQNLVRGSHFETTPPHLVITDMKNYHKEHQQQKNELHPLELAAWAHWKLVRIHPFQDGNGRTARIIMNYILHSNGYAMIDIKTKEKQQYFNALEKCHYNNNGKALAIRLVRRFKKQYQNALAEDGESR